MHGPYAVAHGPSEVSRSREEEVNRRFKNKNNRDKEMTSLLSMMALIELQFKLSKDL